MSDPGPILIVDVGSASLKAGYAGDDVPSTIIPAVTMKHRVEIDALENYDISLDSSNSSSLKSSIGSHPVVRGVVKNWDQLEELWALTMNDLGLTSADGSYNCPSVMIIENPRSTISDRAKWADMLFEKCKAPSVYFANSCTLSLFASGRTSGLVIESGAGVTSVSPVFEGLALAHAFGSIEFGGQDISAHLMNSINSTQINADSSKCIDLHYARLLKERLSFVNLGKDINDKRERPRCILPDGTELDVKASSFGDCCEQLFVDPSIECGGLISQIHESLLLCDDSVIREMSNNIIISGGTSMLPGFGDRVLADLKGLLHNTKLPGNHSSKHTKGSEIRVLPSTVFRESGYTSQRKIAAWIGGSIVSSLDTFRQIKITRQEYEESQENSAIRSKFL